MQRRRDPRFALREGSAVLELADPRDDASRVRGTVKRISAAGLGFESHGWWRGLAPGATLSGAVLRVGDCVLRGTVVVVNLTQQGPDVAELGALFHPESPQGEDRLMTLLAGIEAAAPETTRQPRDLPL
jgi:hypothetical protein